MRKKIMLVVNLGLCAALLASCSSGTSKKPYTVITQPTQSLYGSADTATDAPAQDTGDNGAVNFDDGTYDPEAEESSIPAEDIFLLTAQPVAEATVAPTVNSVYAGASPVVIDPIDKPTPTPLPTLTFTYQSYNASRLHLTFEAPAGWEVDDTGTDTYILRQPASQMAGYQSTITLRAASVNSSYGTNDLKSEVIAMMNTINDDQFSAFDKSNTAARTFLGTSGIYANWTGTLKDGDVEVGGRVHAVCINNVLYTVSVTFPRGYRNTYIDLVYSHIRKTIKIE